MNIPIDNYVWLAVKIEGNIWPKKQINPPYKAWLEQIEEYGNEKKFGLILMVVNNASHQKILSWQKIRKEDQNWSPIERLQNMTILDALQLRLKHKQ